MLSTSHDYVQLPGANIRLNCEFLMDGFRPFDNPVIWEKSQAAVTVDYSRLTINVMSVVQPPFLSTGRFAVSFLAQPPLYTLSLAIRGQPCICNVIVVEHAQSNTRLSFCNGCAAAALRMRYN
jgi:hypothetical protein